MLTVLETRHHAYAVYDDRRHDETHPKKRSAAITSVSINSRAALSAPVGRVGA